ncbi:hypothetical protein EDEG_02517 [Edhazardia aedis USNM 41457]|uniref:Uncharacterized protein n=1 Tax=Edhazardia aedis (strain USNM 41457) TaxID=1003232 RepID=J9D6H2_EDHAE|nr:hypothetical protein EDEG_02517 [Edhazardia aedis USNM 41457]|eukprot:EJW03109.1 hypothetical protein EDEG_02517 [Edhazardia aedis USNM 41457]
MLFNFTTFYSLFRFVRLHPHTNISMPQKNTGHNNINENLLDNTLKRARNTECENDSSRRAKIHKMNYEVVLTNPNTSTTFNGEEFEHNNIKIEKSDVLGAFEYFDHSFKLLLSTIKDFCYESLILPIEVTKNAANSLEEFLICINTYLSNSEAKNQDKKEFSQCLMNEAIYFKRQLLVVPLFFNRLFEEVRIKFLQQEHDEFFNRLVKMRDSTIFYLYGISSSSQNFQKENEKLDNAVFPCFKTYLLPFVSTLKNSTYQNEIDLASVILDMNLDIFLKNLEDSYAQIEKCIQNLDNSLKKFTDLYRNFVKNQTDNETVGTQLSLLENFYDILKRFLLDLSNNSHQILSEQITEAVNVHKSFYVTFQEHMKKFPASKIEDISDSYCEFRHCFQVCIEAIYSMRSKIHLKQIEISGDLKTFNSHFINCNLASSIPQQYENFKNLLEFFFDKYKYCLSSLFITSQIECFKYKKHVNELNTHVNTDDSILEAHKNSRKISLKKRYKIIRFHRLWLKKTLEKYKESRQSYIVKTGSSREYIKTIIKESQCSLLNVCNVFLSYVSTLNYILLAEENFVYIQVKKNIVGFACLKFYVSYDIFIKILGYQSEKDKFQKIFEQQRNVINSMNTMTYHYKSYISSLTKLTNNKHENWIKKNQKIVQCIDLIKNVIESHLTSLNYLLSGIKIDTNIICAKKLIFLLEEYQNVVVLFTFPSYRFSIDKSSQQIDNAEKKIITALNDSLNVLNTFQLTMKSNFNSIEKQHEQVFKDLMHFEDLLYACQSELNESTDIKSVIDRFKNFKKHFIEFKNYQNNNKISCDLIDSFKQFKTLFEGYIKYFHNVSRQENIKSMFEELKNTFLELCTSSSVNSQQNLSNSQKMENAFLNYHKYFLEYIKNFPGYILRKKIINGIENFDNSFDTYILMHISSQEYFRRTLFAINSLKISFRRKFSIRNTFDAQMNVKLADSALQNLYDSVHLYHKHFINTESTIQKFMQWYENIILSRENKNQQYKNPCSDFFNEFEPYISTLYLPDQNEEFSRVFNNLLKYLENYKRSKKTVFSNSISN